MEARYYEKLHNEKVRCHVCHHHCVIKHNEVGICGVRLNLDGTLHALNYGQTIAGHVDPIEKKPLFHFLPGSLTYSIATVGCNLHCPWCQNHEISQTKYVGFRLPGVSISPEEHIKEVVRHRLPSISYTYSEPTIYIEYAIDIMRLAHDIGIKNIWVTNGYMTQTVLLDILPFLDAVNIDYKGSGDRIYDDIIGGKSEYVLENIRLMVEAGIHVEVTTLIVPGINDEPEQLNQIASDIANISPDIPWHISRYFPNYKYTHVPKTPISTLQEAFRIGMEAGLKHIYLGNV